MAELSDLVASTHRLPYEQLLAFLRTCSPAEFTRQVRHPLLVGHKLYRGQLVARPGLRTGTLRFNLAHLQEELARARLDLEAERNRDVASAAPDDSLTQAIFVLVKRIPSRTPPNVFTVGRGGENDVVIADYSVSKVHAEITASYNTYSIADVGSTNGTAVDDETIPANAKVPLGPNAVIGFGRLSFVFMRPADLYTALIPRINPSG